MVRPLVVWQRFEPRPLVGGQLAERSLHLCVSYPLRRCNLGLGFPGYGYSVNHFVDVLARATNRIRRNWKFGAWLGSVGLLPTFGFELG